MIPEFTAAVTAATHATKLIASVLETVHDTKSKQVVLNLQNGVLDLQSKLYAAQAKYQELADIKREAEQKLIEYEQWDSEAARYELKEIATGIFVRSLKPNDSRSEPQHWLCPNCFEHRKKSILVRPHVDHLNYGSSGF